MWLILRHRVFKKVQYFSLIQMCDSSRKQIPSTYMLPPTQTSITFQPSDVLWTFAYTAAHVHSPLGHVLAMVLHGKEDKSAKHRNP